VKLENSSLFVTDDSRRSSHDPNIIRTSLQKQAHLIGQLQNFYRSTFGLARNKPLDGRIFGPIPVPTPLL
jgi:hypothetical protein